MKLAAYSIALLVAQVSAFAPPMFEASRSTALSAKTESSRAEFFTQMGGVLGTVMLSSPGIANAAKYGGFGAGSPNVLDPTEAIVDKDMLSSDSVQRSLGGIKTYLETVKKIQDALKSNPQADVAPFVRKEFDFSKLRTDLETLNNVFDEDTQRGTDRVIRLILQDITELETASTQKDGVTRSERRLAIMNGKLDKLTQAFQDFLAFAN